MQRVLLAAAILVVCVPVLMADDELAKAVADDYDAPLTRRLCERMVGPPEAVVVVSIRHASQQDITPNDL